MLLLLLASTLHHNRELSAARETRSSLMKWPITPIMWSLQPINMPHPIPLLPIIERLGILLLVDILMLSVVDVAVVTVIINLTSLGCVYRNSHFICFRYFRYLTTVLTVCSQLTGGGRWSRGLITLQLDFNPRPDRAEHHHSAERGM